VIQYLSREMCFYRRIAVTNEYTTKTLNILTDIWKQVVG
jgi:hypothetical protein